MTEEANLIAEKYKSQVMEQLEKTGVIGRLRAQLKSNVFKALEGQSKVVKQTLEFDYLTPFHKQQKTKDMILAVHLIKEFLEFYEMEYTLPVFENETNIREKLQKESLIKEIGIQNYEDKQPLLLNLLFSYYFFKENYNNNAQNTITNQFNKTTSMNNNESKFSSLKNPANNNEEIAELISEIKEKSNPSSGNGEGSQKVEPIKSKKLPPIHFSAGNDNSENNSPTQKNEKLKKFEENSPTNKKMSTNTSSSQSNTGFTSTGNQASAGSNSFSNSQNNITNLNQTVKKSGNTITPANNSSNLTSNKLSNLNYQNNVNDLKDDILEEIDIDSVEDIEDKNDKKNTSGSGVFASSQTFGYDNSVTSYNLDFYDYIEDVEKV
jgi:hypothetical protein